MRFFDAVVQLESFSIGLHLFFFSAVLPSLGLSFFVEAGPARKIRPSSSLEKFQLEVLISCKKLHRELRFSASTTKEILEPGVQKDTQIAQFEVHAAFASTLYTLSLEQNKQTEQQADCNTGE